ncbi:MAG: 2-hydroxymuconate tautomerase family protein [Sneathiella sp.]|nr:2-hydroxymuconate tautomerase family protein [Sneathiella sp.]
MPIVRIDMFEGRDRKTKQELVKSITAEMVRITGCGEASVNIVINDVAKDNWGMGGELASDKSPK